MEDVIVATAQFENISADKKQNLVQISELSASNKRC